MDASQEPHLPPSVRRRYVLDGEQLVVAIHQHPVVVAEPVLTAVAILVLVIVVDTHVSAGLGGVVNVLWWVWFAAVARAVWMVFEWRQQWVVATNKRLMLTYGFIVRKVAMMPLSKVTDMSYHRSIAGRIFGWGTFVMESAGQQQALSEIRFVPNPDHNYRALCAEIFAVEDRERVTAVDEDVDEAHAWPDERDEDDLYRDVVQVEPGPMRMQRVAPATRRDRDRWDEDWQQDRDAERARAAGRDAGRGAGGRDERGRDGRGWAGRGAPGRGPRDGHDTADLPVVDARVSQDAEARELLSSWERFAERYDNQPERGPDSGTSIYRSGGDPLS
ncbi:PH domain-containing protein [Arsenicicoccus cauae]|uniref:PH domain-containing protein n=2 Tax=Arsenicicoccus TaxID=267408 RepID=UPI00370D13A5